MKQKESLLSSGKVPNSCCKHDVSADSADFLLSFGLTDYNVILRCYISDM